MIKLYERLTHNCQTINQWNHAHLTLQKKMTPLQLAILTQQLFTTENEHTRAWLSTINRLYFKSGKVQPEPFIKKRLSPHLMLFSDPHTDSRQKSLLVAFTGGSQLMMMPIPVFLQQFDAKSVDILMVRYPKPLGYQQGLTGIGDNIDSTLTQLRNFFPQQSYQRYMTIGVSGGGVPALLMALKHGFEHCLAIGLNAPDDPRWSAVLPNSVGELAKSYAQQLSKLPKISLVYGAELSTDKQATLKWSHWLSCKIIAVPTANHVAISPLLDNGKLCQFFNRSLFQAI